MMKKTTMKKSFMLLMVFALVITFTLPVMAAAPEFSYEFKSMTGGGYFLDPYSSFYDECTFGFNAHLTEEGLKVNLEFTDPIYYEGPPITVTFNGIADTYSINGETSLSFKVPATVQVGDGEPYVTNVNVTATDADVDTFDITIGNASWNTQPLAGGSIQAHFQKNKQ